MPYEKRFHEIMETIGEFSPKSIFTKATLFSAFILLFCELYIFMRRGIHTLTDFNNGIANASVILIGLSFALSGMCYFWDIFARKLLYRKHLGLYGFSLALIHSVLALYTMRDQFPFPRSDTVHLASMITAIAAIVILTMMAAISNRFAIHELGGKSWRMLLRMGYLAYILVIVHFTALNYTEWLSFVGMPPLDLIIFIFAIWVFVIRTALGISLFYKKFVSK